MRVITSAPGRICLFGEHQDYFGFPVVASAIGLRGMIESETRSDRRVHLELLDLEDSKEWDLDALPEPGPRDYWLSALHVAKKEGWLPPVGWNARVTSQIPQQAGASSSSALTAAWCALIALRHGRVVDNEAGREWIAHATWRSEVQWFNEPGGMMDQVMCAMGGTREIQFNPNFQTRQLTNPSGVWTLIDSQQPQRHTGYSILCQEAPFGTDCPMGGGNRRRMARRISCSAPRLDRCGASPDGCNHPNTRGVEPRCWATRLPTESHRRHRKTANGTSPLAFPRPRSFHVQNRRIARGFAGSRSPRRKNQRIRRWRDIFCSQHR